MFVLKKTPVKPDFALFCSAFSWIYTSNSSVSGLQITMAQIQLQQSPGEKFNNIKEAGAMGILTVLFPPFFFSCSYNKHNGYKLMEKQ